MDANGTQFHLLFGKNDWASCLDGQELHLSTAWNEDGAGGHATDLSWDSKTNELTLKPIFFLYVASPLDQPPEIDDRRGAGRDRYGNWYWIGDSRMEILVLSAGPGVTSHFWSVEDLENCRHDFAAGDFRPLESPQLPTPLKFSGLTVTEDHHLVVGVLDPAGILIFDLHAGGPPQQLFWPQKIGFVPFDMAPRPGGGLWILDRINRRYWSLDRYFNVCGEDQEEETLMPEVEHAFQPIDGSPVRRVKRRTFPRGISLKLSSPVLVSDPIAIESLPDGSVLILDGQPEPGQPFSKIVRYRFGRMLGAPRSLESITENIDAERHPDFGLIAHDFAFAAEQSDTDTEILGQLYFAGQKGNQAYAFDLELDIQSEIGGTVAQFELKPVDKFFPMRLFGGKALVAAGQKVFYDFSDRWIPLTDQHRPLYVTQASVLTPFGKSEMPAETFQTAFDGGMPDCTWHRLIIDACIPPETQVVVLSRAANRAADLRLTPWEQEPDLYKRLDGCELPYYRHPDVEDFGSWELLFQRARGRYLQLKILLKGDGRSTPRLRALRAYFPRFSYLQHYLPDVYREDAHSAAFLDRFLANLEGFYTTIEDKIAAVQMLFDVRSAPPETLDWLAVWFDIALDPAWDEAKQRLFIKHAMDFFQYRGTIRGLRMALRLVFDDHPDEGIFSEPESALRGFGRPRVIERFRTRRTPGILFGDPTEASLGPRRIATGTRWRPVQGREELNRRYSQALQLPGIEPFPIRPPAENRAAAWQQFAQGTLGFIPEAGMAERQRWQNYLTGRYPTIAELNANHGTQWADYPDVSLPADLPSNVNRRSDWLTFLRETSSPAPLNRSLWQSFLQHRYQTIIALNSAYGTQWTGFEQVALPESLPPDGPALLDWYQFESVVLPMQRTAHRFRVLLPVPSTLVLNSAEHQQRLDLARRVLELEKPAHAVFEVKFFWAMFRVGEARLEEDTLIDLGSRAPQLFPAMVLGQGYLAESFLAPTHPRDVYDRQILGRDRLKG